MTQDDALLAVNLLIDNKYRIDGIIGKGGMGTVYEATQVAIGRKVALKHFISHSSDNESELKRFKREASAAGSIGHDNICEVTDLGVAPDGSPYLIMPLLQGNTLSEMLLDCVSFSPKRTVDIICQILSALEEVHKAEIIHRDLKPANVFITKLGDRPDFIKLLDFGVAKLLATETATVLTRPGDIVGTPHYMAPEQIKDSAGVDHRTDIYAVGIILYEMLAGRRPFDGDSFNEVFYKILSLPAPAPREVNPYISEALEQVIFRATAKEPDDRYPSAASMHQALTSAIKREETEKQEQDSTTAFFEEPDSVSPDSSNYPCEPTSSPSIAEANLACDNSAQYITSSASSVAPSSSQRSQHSSAPPSSPVSPILGAPESLGENEYSEIRGQTENEIWIRYRGRDILLRDYSNLNPEEMFKVSEASLQTAYDLIAENRYDLLLMADMTNARSDKRTVQNIKKISTVLAPHTKKLAIVGLSGLQRTFMYTINVVSGQRMQPFENREDALNWLTKE